MKSRKWCNMLAKIETKVIVIVSKNLNQTDFIKSFQISICLYITTKRTLKSIAIAKTKIDIMYSNLAYQCFFFPSNEMTFICFIFQYNLNKFIDSIFGGCLKFSPHLFFSIILTIVNFFSFLGRKKN